MERMFQTRIPTGTCLTTATITANKGIEQMNIEFYGLDNLGNTNNGIAPTSADYPIARAAAIDALNADPEMRARMIYAKQLDISMNDYSTPYAELSPEDAATVRLGAVEAFVGEITGPFGAIGGGGGGGSSDDEEA
jgi:hypothetical protein